MKSNKGKYGALLGVLIVFIIPFIVVTVVYFSKKPPVYKLPVLNETPIEQKTYPTLGDDSISIERFAQDLKLIFRSNKNNYKEKIQLLTNYYQETRDYPEKTFKDPYPQVVFIQLFTDSLNQSINEVPDESWFTVPIATIDDPVLLDAVEKDVLLLVDRDGLIRATYPVRKESLPQLKKDVQNLLAETYHLNSKESRKKRDKL